MKEILLRLSGILLISVFFLSLSGSASAAKFEFKVKSHQHASVCANNGHDVHCNARVIVQEDGVTPETTSGPSGYGPTQIHAGYNLPNTVAMASGSAVPVVAIIDAYDQPNILSDLNVYSLQFGLPQMSNCSGPIGGSTTTCFQKVDQNGGNAYPSVNSGWALESSLDVEIAHAVCQNCSLLLVEAKSSSYTDLMTAVDQAVAQGAKVVSNSYGSREFSGETTFDWHFNHPGVVFTFSSGDSGYGAQYPAASKYVTAVGGTSLFLNTDNTYQSEAVWSGAGSGCSYYESKPSFQHDSGCSRRTIADVSAVADPNTGAAVYDSVPYSGQVGWFQVGGTSLAAPIIAGTYALNGGVGANVQANSVPYMLVNYTSNLHDITLGKNGSCQKRVGYLCSGGINYDGPSGLGSPNGIAAF